MTIAEKIYKIRTELSLSQKEFAKKIGASQASVNFWENGKRIPKIQQISKMCTALDIDLICFLDPLYEIEDESLGLYGELRSLENQFKEDEKKALQIFLDTGQITPPLSDFEISDYYYTLLINHFKNLNHTGESEAVKRLYELTLIPEYSNPRKK